MQNYNLIFKQQNNYRTFSDFYSFFIVFLSKCDQNLPKQIKIAIFEL